MIFIGGGLHERIVKKASQQNPWIHFMGPVFNREQIMYFFEISESFSYARSGRLSDIGLF